MDTFLLALRWALSTRRALRRRQSIGQPFSPESSKGFAISASSFLFLATWISFALASSAYSASLTSASAQPQTGAQPALFSVPLLEQWEQGFTASSAQFGPFSIPLVVFGQRWFTFSHFAIIDALLILGLVIITFIAQMVEAVGLSRARVAMRGVEIRMFNIAENRDTSSLGGQTIEEKTQSAFDAIGSQLAHLRTAVSDFTASMRDVPQTTLNMVADRLTTFETEQTGRIIETYRYAATAQTTTNQQVTQFVNGTDTLLHQITTSVDELTQHWNTLENLETRIGVAAREAAQAAAGAAQTAGELPGEIHSLKTAQDEVKEELARVATTYGQAITRLEDVGKHFDQTAQLQQELTKSQKSAQFQMAALLDSMGKIEALLKRIEQLERALGGVITLNGAKRHGFWSFLQR